MCMTTKIYNFYSSNSYNFYKNLADLFTKRLGSTAHWRLLKKLGMVDISFKLFSGGWCLHSHYIYIDYFGLFEYSPGMTSLGKLIVVDSNRDIIIIYNLSSSQLHPNITSSRTLLPTLNTSGSTPIIL